MTFQGATEGDVTPRATVFIEGMTDNGNATIPPHTDIGTTGGTPTGTLPSYVCKCTRLIYCIYTYIINISYPLYHGVDSRFPEAKAGIKNRL